MVSSPIISWQTDGENVETASDFIFLGSKITVDSDCSHKIKALVPWKNQFGCSVMFDSLRPHGLQHAILPCPSPTPRAYSNSCPSSR